MNTQRNFSLRLRIYLPLGLFFLLVISGCKETSSTTTAGILEHCKILIDQANWTNAIDACDDIETDEGRHLTAQAYMGRAGLSLLSIAGELMGGGDGGAAASVFAFFPDTTADENDYNSALQYLLGKDADDSDYIEEKTQSIYLEGLLISSMLILKQLKLLLGLSIDSNGDFAACDMDETSDNFCAFVPSITMDTSIPDVEVPDKLVFNGLGQTFYSGICGQSDDATHDTVKTTDITTDEDDPASTSDPKEKLTVTVTNNVTVYGCTIQTTSALYYNQVANDNFEGFDDLDDLSVLDFYGRMNNGNNFSIEIIEASGDTAAQEIAFCNTGYIALPSATDTKLNDCEILAMFTDQSSDLF